MKAFVFTDESFREQAGRFAWLEIDTDKAQNTAFREQFPVKALPTYLVIDPHSEQVLFRWIGGASVAQLHQMLDDARGAFDRTRKADLAGNNEGSGGSSADLAGDGEGTGRSMGATETMSPDQLLARSDALYGSGQNAEAAELCARAIETAPADWPSYGRAVEGLLVNWLLDGQCDAAVPMARAVYPRLAATSSAAIVGSVGLDCALQWPEDHPDRAALLEYFEEVCRQAVADRSIPMAADDRSGMYISLLSVRTAVDDSAGALALATEWSQFLEEAAASATTPSERTVFDSHRLSACLQLKQPERAVSMLQQSEHDFPEDYNPPYRLAVAYRAMESWDDALAASERAAERAYGPRLISILRTRADLFVSKGDPAAARAVLEDAITQAEALPESQRSARTIDALKKKLTELP